MSSLKNNNDKTDIFASPDNLGKIVQMDSENWLTLILQYSIVMDLKIYFL